MIAARAFFYARRTRAHADNFTGTLRVERHFHRRGGAQEADAATMTISAFSRRRLSRGDALS